MKITQNVRDYAKNQSNAQQVEEKNAEIAAGFNAMKTTYQEHGQKLYHKL